jgi:hypothetical protein
MVKVPDNFTIGFLPFSLRLTYYYCYLWLKSKMERVQKNITLANIINNSSENRRIIRCDGFVERKNYFSDYNEEKFKKRFRLSKTSFSFVLQKIEHKIKTNTERFVKKYFIKICVENKAE